MAVIPIDDSICESRTIIYSALAVAEWLACVQRCFSDVSLTTHTPAAKQHLKKKQICFFPNKPCKSNSCCIYKIHWETKFPGGKTRKIAMWQDRYVVFASIYIHL